MTMTVKIRKQRRKSLALRLTPAGVEALIPAAMDANGPAVQTFIDEALVRLSEPRECDDPLTSAMLHALVARWCDRLGVVISRVQIRAMRNKWGSISTAGTLTLADDLLILPVDLAEYVIVHELLHRRFPDHGKGWQVSMGVYLPDWRERDRELMAFIMETARAEE